HQRADNHDRREGRRDDPRRAEGTAPRGLTERGRLARRRPGRPRSERENTMNRLDGKVALISGAARGIGGATARLMAEAGARVAIGDVLDEAGRATARAIEAAGGGALYHHLDVTREEDWNAAIAAAVGRFGRLDILVNNAGLFLGKDIETATLDEWHRLCAVNLTGVFLGTKLALPALREAADRPNGDGRRHRPGDPLSRLRRRRVYDRRRPRRRWRHDRAVTPTPPSPACGGGLGRGQSARGVFEQPPCRRVEARPPAPIK